MQVQSTSDVASYATANAQAKVKEQVNISLVKKSMELTEKLMAELQKGLPKPPHNPNGSISLYA